MKKKLLAMVLSLAMIANMAACGGGGDSSSSAAEGSSVVETETTSSDTEQGQEDSTTDPVHQAIDARTEPVKLNVYFQTSMGALDAQADVAAAMSEITRDKLNIEVELQLIDSASYKQSMTLALSSGEQIDLFNTCYLDSYASVVSNGYAVNMEEEDLLQTYGSGILDVIEEKYLDACRIDGSIYGLPTMRDMARGLFGLAVGAQYLDGIGYEYSDDDIIYVDAEEINSILAQLYEAFPDKTVMKSGVLTQNILYDQLGGDNFGVLLDPTNDLTVEDFFSSDLYYDYCKMFYEWNQAGYISQDAMTSDTAGTTEVRAGTLMSYLCATKPGIRAQESKLCAQEMVLLQAGDNFMSSSAVSGISWCISFTTIDKVASMQLLNELYTNPELSRLICWGREGEEWVESEDGHLTYPEDVTADTSAYAHSVNWEMPNQFIAGVWEGDDLGIWDEMEEFNNTASTSKALGFTFDNSELMNEYTAMVNIYNEYQKQLEMGFLNPDEGIPEMVQRLKDAGLDKYIAEKQVQLDAWAEENGVA